jgi:hypothetical protein
MILNNNKYTKEVADRAVMCCKSVDVKIDANTL